MLRRPLRGVLTVGIAAFAAVLLTATAASAATTVGLWHLNEPAGAHTAVDSSGFGQNGSVGSDVQTGVNYDGATAYRFPAVADRTVARPQHIVTIPHSSRLNPGTGRWAVTIRFRTTTTHDNISQKGQGGTAGGYWKVELAKAAVRCTFKDGSGHALAIPSAQLVNDGRWHTVTCERSASAIAVTLDGVRKTRSGTLGTIANSWEMAIGGKSRCDGVQVSCDYFTGDVDDVRVTRG